MLRWSVNGTRKIYNNSSNALTTAAITISTALRQAFGVSACPACPAVSHPYSLSRRAAVVRGTNGGGLGQGA